MTSLTDSSIMDCRDAYPSGCASSWLSACGAALASDQPINQQQRFIQGGNFHQSRNDLSQGNQKL